MKKGQVEISFNWVFVIIVGGIFLLFFVLIGNNLTKDATDTTDIKVAQRLKTVLSASERNDGSATIQDKKISFETKFFCEEGTLFYGVKDSNVDPTILSSNTIYVPEIIGDSKLISWSKTYSAPYKITSTLMLSDEKTMYIFEEGDALTEQLYEEFPKEFNKQLVDIDAMTNLKDEGLRKYIFILATDPGGLFLSPENSFRSKVSILHVQGSTNYGKISYYYFETPYRNIDIKSDGTYGFISKEMVYGGIVSGDASLYQCTRNKVLNRAKITAKIYNETINLLADEFTSNPRCNIFYGVLSTGPLDNMIFFDLDNFDKPGAPNYQTYYNSINSLEQVNLQLGRDSCPSIY